MPGSFLIVALILSASFVTGCTSNAPEEDTATATDDGGGTGGAANDEPGDMVTIGFSAPAADHGWMGAITKSALAEAEKYSDVDLVVAEATNDVNLQISQIEQFINDGVDAIVLLPFDGAALTEVATQAMTSRSWVSMAKATRTTSRFQQGISKPSEDQRWFDAAAMTVPSCARMGCRAVWGWSSNDAWRMRRKTRL